MCGNYKCEVSLRVSNWLKLTRNEKICVIISTDNNGNYAKNKYFCILNQHTKGQTSYQVLEQTALDAKWQERDRNHFTGRFNMSFCYKDKRQIN